MDSDVKKVYAETNGKIFYVNVKEGNKVWPGKILFKIDDGSDTYTFIDARNEGVVKRIYVRRGDKCVKDQLLMEIDAWYSSKGKDTLKGVKEYVNPNSNKEYSKISRENSRKEKRHSRDSVSKPVETNENVYQQDSKKRKTSIAAQEWSKSSDDVEEGEIIES